VAYVDKKTLDLAQQAEVVGSIRMLLIESGLATVDDSAVGVTEVIDGSALDISIASESMFDELLEQLVMDDAEDDAEIEKLDKLVKLYQKRKAAAEARQENRRAIILTALQQAGIPSRKLAVGTVTEKAVADKLIISPEADGEIPTRFFKLGDPKLMKNDLKAYVVARTAALEALAKIEDPAGREAAREKFEDEFPYDIKGVSIETGNTTVQIRR
jgi:hypothetical protein